ncbi:glycosyltransferase [Streptomyces sp. NPDC047017]|uniref:glycosyltransferase family 2 protein n=1 Tax=Streptomyces sp. NPDC047017 TaxID=3155024 RepID=UPI0033C74475
MSVVCPTFNRSHALAPTLDSVRAQSMPDWEMIVVSDGSTDDTDDVVRATAREDARVRLVRTRRHGHPSGPRATALAEACGEVIAYLDHDDRWRTGHLSTVLAAVDAGAELVATGFELHDRHERTTSRSEPYAMCWHPEMQVLGPIFEPSRVAHRRGLAERAGGWRTAGGLEDWDLWLRMSDGGARFTTVTDRTAVLLDDVGTRRHRLPVAHHMPLAAYDDPRHAHAVLRELESGLRDEEFRAVHAADSRAWLTRLVASDDFVRPLGWAGDPTAELTAAMVAGAPLRSGLVVYRQRDRFVLAQPLRCASAGHARRILEAARRTQPGTFRLIADLSRRVLADAR